MLVSTVVVQDSAIDALRNLYLAVCTSLEGRASFIIVDDPAGAMLHEAEHVMSGGRKETAVALEPIVGAQSPRRGTLVDGGLPSRFRLGEFPRKSRHGREFFGKDSFNSLGSGDGFG